MTKRLSTILFIIIFCFSVKAEIFSWAIQTENYYAVCSDASGNIYTTGAVPLIKYDASGHESMRITSKDTVRGQAIKTDDQGNIYISGIFSSSLTFGSLSVQSKGKTDAFIAKFDATGTPVWLQSGGGTDYDDCRNMDIDAEGNLFISGTFTSSANFGGYFFSGQEYKDVYVVAYKNDGSIKWAQSIVGTSGAGGSDFTAVDCISAAGKGSCFISGYFNGSMVIAGKKYVPSGSYDGFIAKLTGIASAEYVKSYPNAKISTIHPNQSGDVFIGGSFFQSTDIGNVHLKVDSALASNILLARLDASGGVIWAEKAGGNYDDDIADFVLDGSDNIYFTGYFSQVAKFGNTHLSSQGERDVLVGKYDGDGNKLWVMGVGNTGEDQGISICLNNKADKVYVIGAVQYGAVYFGSTLLQNNNGFAFLTAVGDVSASVRESSSNSCDLNLYPNPGNGPITISLDRIPSPDARLIIYDMLGKAILSQKIVQVKTVIDHIPAGTYIAVYQDEEETIRKKMVVQ